MTGRSASLDAFQRLALAVGADVRRPLVERLVRMAALARRAFGAERAWIATAEANVPGLGHTIAEDCDPLFPGVVAEAEPVPLQAFHPQIEAMRQAGAAVLFSDPFPELGDEGREFLRRYHVLATAQSLAASTADNTTWLVGLDFCRARPPWSDRDARQLEQFAAAAALVIESALLFNAAEQAERELQTVFETQRDGVALIDGGGVIVRCNQAYTRLLHAPRPAALAGQAHTACVAPHGAVEGCSLERARRSGSGSLTFHDNQPHGSRWLECTVQRVEGAGDLFVQVLRDITEQRLLSERAAQQGTFESLGTLAGGVAHEFNNILMGMVPAIERMRAEGTGDHDAIATISGLVERGGELARRMLALSRHHSAFVGRAPLGPTLHDVVSVLRGSLPKNIKVEVAAEPELGWVGLDSAGLHSVFLNLATNARDAMPDGGVLRVEARVEGDPAHRRTVVTVADTGSGIAANDLPRIFDPFFTTKKAGEGTGLGLPLVYRLVSQAGGSVAAYSDGPGRGARFVVELPLVEPAAASTERALGREPQRLAGARILVVDDEPAIRDGIAGLLAATGVAVVAADCGEQALTCFAADPWGFDAAVVDHGLPGMNGSSVIGELLRLRPDLTVVLASGYAETDRFEDLRDRGVCFFQKPFRVDDLVAHLVAALGAKTRTADTGR